MKKYFFTIALAWACVSVSIAQLPSIPKLSFSFGPKIGVRFTQLATSQEAITNSPGIGGEAGLFFRLGINKLYFQPEVLYAISKGIINSSGLISKQEVTLKSIDVPVIVGLKYGFNKLNLRIFTGPLASFSTNQELKTTSIFGETNTNSAALKDAFYSLLFGVGADIIKVSVDVRYMMGLNYHYIDKDMASEIKWKQNLFVVSLGLKIH